MPKVIDIFSSIFLKEESVKNEKTKTLKVFYNMDIHIKNPNKGTQQTKTQEEPQQEIQLQNVQPQAQQTSAPIQPPTQTELPQVPTEEKIYHKAKKVFLEDEFTLGSGKSGNGDYIYKNEGVISVPREEYENIQSIEDLLDFLSDSNDEKDNKILDEAAVELILSMIGITQTPLEDIVKKEDKVLIDVSYGNKKDDSIGFKVLKRDGVNNLSITMKKNNEILDAKFDLKSFNSQILEFRNGIIHATKK